MSLSRTGRPLTKRYCPSAFARVSDGAAAKPSTTTPSRSARTSIALERKSPPRISPSRVSRPAAPGSAAAQVTGARSSPESVEEIADLDAGALRQRRRHDLRFLAAFDRQRPGVRFAAMPRGDAEPGDRADRGQGFAAEPERANAQEILIVELGG